MWTRFMDMHSGGGSKEEWDKILIEAPEKIARVIFYNRFNHNPERVTCTCCGEDYSISEEKTLEQATAYDRNCAYDKDLKRYIEKQDPDKLRWGGENLYMTVATYAKEKNVLIIRKKDIKPGETEGDIPDQGYV